MGFLKGETALRLAQKKGNREIIQMLKKVGAKEQYFSRIRLLNRSSRTPHAYWDGK